MSSLRSISFTLPFVMPSLNIRDRTHWAKRHRQADALWGEVLAAIGGPRYLPRPPLGWTEAGQPAQCRVTIVRHGKHLLDEDNLRGAHKPLVDCLCVQCAAHPHGLGIILDDSPKYVTMHIHQQPAVGKPCTVVTVEELEKRGHPGTSGSSTGARSGRQYNPATFSA